MLVFDQITLISEKTSGFDAKCTRNKERKKKLFEKRTDRFICGGKSIIFHIFGHTVHISVEDLLNILLNIA